MSIKQVKRGWQADFRLGGRRGRRIRKTFPNHLLAKKYQARLLGENLGRKYFPDSHESSVSFAEFVEEYIQKHVYKLTWGKFVVYQLGVLKQFFGRIPLAEIDANDLEEWLSDFSVGKKQATINNYTALLKTLFKKAVQWKKIKFSPAQYLEKPDPRNQRNRPASPDELKRIWNVASSRLKGFLIAELNSGMRKGRVEELEWSDINLDTRNVQVMNRKGRKYTIPLNQVFYDYLISLPHRVGRVIDSTNLRKDWMKACEMAKVVDLHIHDLRHTFATVMADNEKNLLPVKEALGHSTIVVTADRYTHIINDGLRKAFERAAFKPGEDSVHKVSTGEHKQADSDLNRLTVS